MTDPVETFDIEMTVIGNLLMRAGAADVMEGLREDYFSDPSCRALFPIIKDAIHRYGRADNEVVLTVMRSLGSDQQTSKDFLAKAASLAMPDISMSGLTDSLARAWQRRAVHTTGTELLAKAAAGVEPEDIGRHAIDELDRILTARRPRTARPSSLYAAADRALTRMEGDARTDPPLTTGLAELDRILGGYMRGNLVILAGRPGMAKSTFASSSGMRTAASGAGALAFSKEMTADQWSTRALCDLAYEVGNDPIPYQTVLRGDPIDTASHEALIKAGIRMKGLPFIIDPTPGLSVSEIVNRMRTRKTAFERNGKRLGLAVIDHLGKIRGDRRDNRNLELGDITGALADAAKELDLCVLLLCQLNRNVESRDNKRPQLSDLRESGRIEEDADAVIGLYREAYYLDRMKNDDPDAAVRLLQCEHDLEAIVLKNRHGATGTANLFIELSAAAVRDKAVGGSYPQRFAA